MRVKPKSCEKCGVARVIMVIGGRIKYQGRAEGAAMGNVTVTLAPLCVPCFLKQIGLEIKWDAIPKEFKVDVESPEEDEKAQPDAAVLTRQDVLAGKKLTREQVKALKAKHGKHGFCYKCGSIDLSPVGDQHLHPGYMECRNCGSSDLDAG